MKQMKASIKKSISWFVCMTILSFNLGAQLPINIEVEVIGPFPLQYQYWVSEGANYIIPVTNYSGVSHNYFLRATIQGVGPNNSDVFLQVKEEFIPEMELVIGPYETTILTGNDIADSYGPVELSDFNISPAVDQDINASLPEGEYQICFEVLYHPEDDISGNYFLGPSTCSESFTATQGDLELITPFNGDILSLDLAPYYFSWILNSSFLSEIESSYRLKIFQLPNGLDESLEEAIRGGAFPAYYITEPSEDLFFIYDTDLGYPEFIDGYQYAAIVEMVSDDGLYIENGKKSNINVFTFIEDGIDGSGGNGGNGDGDDDEAFVECMNRCSPELPSNQEVNADLGSITQFVMGNFTINNLDITNVSNNKIYGTGEVTFDFLNNAILNVSFSNVEVNTDGIAYNGLVQGIAKPSEASFLQNLISLLDANSPIPDNDIQTLYEIVNGFDVIQSVINGEPQDLPFGLNKSVGGQDFVFSVTDFSLTPTDIDMDIINILGLSGFSANIYLAVGGSNICVSPDGFGQTFSFSLLNDNLIQLDAGMELTFSGGNYDPNIPFDGANFEVPCHIDIDCDGFSAMAISGEIKFPESMLKKEDENGVVVNNQKVAAKFFTSYERMSDDDIDGDGEIQSNFLAQLSMDPFQINGLDGWGFELLEGSLDLSQIENADDFQFPENYEFLDGEPELWQGLYLKELKIMAPQDYSEGETRGEGLISNLLIDPLISGSIEANNLLGIDDGNYKGWAMSIEGLGLTILQNSFEEGYINGQFGSPVFSASEYLNYNALIDQKTDEEENEDYYVFNALVQPSQDIDIPFAIANANICGSSYLAMQMSPKEEDRQVELFMKGGMNMNTDMFGGNLLGNATLNIADYQIKYNSVDGFIMQQEVDDGTGSYFGWAGENDHECEENPNIQLNEVFDQLIDKYRLDGESLDRTVPAEEDQEEIASDDFEDGNEMNGLPIRLKNSSFETVQGNPKLNLGVEMELSEGQLSEAGMIILGNKVTVGEKYHFGVENVSFYYSDGTFTMEKPFDGSGLVTDQPILCEWSTNLVGEDLLDRLRYSLTIVKISEDTEEDDLVNIFNEPDSLFFEIDDIEGLQHSIPLTAPSNPFVEGNYYAVRIQAVDPTGEEDLVNDGFSTINTFVFGQTVDDPSNEVAATACAERCSPPSPSNEVTLTPNDQIQNFTMGNFTISEITSLDIQGNQINGLGEVQLDFLNNVKVKVQFNNVLLNTDYQAFSGTVNGVDESDDPDLLEGVANYLSGQVTEGAEVIQGMKEAIQLGRMVHDIAVGASIGLPFGINANMGGNEVVIAFTDFNLTPTSSDVDFMNLMSFPSLGENFSFGLGATDICLAPDGFGQEMRLSFVQDLVIPIDGSIDFIIKGGSSENLGANDSEPSYLEIDCNGFKSLNVAGEVLFPQNMLIKEDDQGNMNLAEQVKAAFGIKFERQAGEDAYSGESGESSTHIMASLSMDRFQVNGLEGWSFEVTDAYLDLSELENPADMTFPEEYDFADITGTEELWKGFYLKNMLISPPASLDYEGERTSINVHNLLIDPQLSVSVQIADNILPFERGNVKGWGMSIDTFELNILQNNFVNGSMKGQFGTPIMAEQDFLRYDAILSRETEEITEDSYFMFNAIVRPPDEGYTIEIPMAGAPDINICSSSYLGLQLSPQEDETHFEVFLKGNMGVDIGQFLGDGEGEFNLAAAQFQFKYNTVKGFVLEQDVGDGSGTTFGVGLAVSDGCTELYTPDFQSLMDDYDSEIDQTTRTVAFGEPDEEDGDDSADDEDITNEENVMNGFPIRLSGFQLGLNGGAPELGFTVDLALSSGGQGLVAGASLSLVTERVENANNKLGFRFARIDFGCARLACDFDFMLLVACLCHENDNGLNGYFGQVYANINNAVNIDLKGGFGTMGSKVDGAYGTEDFYGLWYVDAKVSMPNGIVMGPVTLNGVGGGIYWNLDPPPMPGQDEFLDESRGDDEGGSLDAVAECMTDLITRYELEVPSSVTAELSQGGPTPSFGKRAIKLNASLSIIKPELVIIDPLVEVEWTDGEGIDAITVGGYVYILQDSYNGRGAPPGNPPSNKNDETGETLSTSSRNPSEGIGSRLWMSSFNTIYLHRVPDQNGNTTRTMVAYEGVGSVYLNIIPNMLFGTQTDSDPYRFINKEIVIGDVDHPVFSNRGYQTAGGGETYWHAYFGNPYGPPGPGAVSFDLMGAVSGQSSEANTNAGAKIEATAYFMTGHGIPAELPPVPDMILNIIGRSQGADGDNGGSFSGEEIDQEASREGNTTSGLAFGGSVNLAVGFNKVIYADLNVNIGMDLLMINSNGMTCAANGQIYSPPGMAGFYGMGQAYAGLEGALGVRGKILGKQIDIQFLELGAAMMIAVGGPKPFWVDGKAGVYYSVLGGMIEGNAYVEVSVGDRCYPYDSGLFSLDAIDRVFPGPDQVGPEAVSPYIKPSVTFKVKVAEKDKPWLSQMQLPVVGPSGNTNLVTLAPVIEEFTVIPDPGSNNPLSCPGDWEISTSRRKVTYHPDGIMAGTDEDTKRRRWQLYIKVKAKQKNGSSWEYVPGFTDDSTVVFSTNPLDPYIEHVTHTNPIRGQNYFMSDEWNKDAITEVEYIGEAPQNGDGKNDSRDDRGDRDDRGNGDDRETEREKNKEAERNGETEREGRNGGKEQDKSVVRTDDIANQNIQNDKVDERESIITRIYQDHGVIKLYANEMSNRFYSTDSTNNPCFYEVVFKKPFDDEEVYRHRLTNSQIEMQNQTLRFPIPDLESDETYVMQLVRIKELLPGQVFNLGVRPMSIYGATISEDIQDQYDVYNNYKISYQQEAIDPYLDVNAGETLMHMIAFSTSEFRTLREKLENVDVNHVSTNSIFSQYDYNLIEILDLTESFEEIELIGYDHRVKVEGEPASFHFTEPRVQLIDPLDGQYFDDYVKPVVNPYLVKMRDHIDQQDVGLRMGEFDLGDFEIDFGPPEIEGIGLGGFGGPNADLSILEVNNNDDVYLLNFYEESYPLINSYNYQNGNSNIYAERSLILEDILTSESYLKSPISQEGLIEFTYNGVTYSFSSNNLLSFSTDNIVKIKYETREIVEEEIEIMAQWGEQYVQEITFPQSNVYYQSWNDSQIEANISPFVDAFNDLINSEVYLGGLDEIELNPDDSGYQFQLFGQEETIYFEIHPFRSSEIIARYSLKDVTGENNTPIFGTRKRMTLN